MVHRNLLNTAEAAAYIGVKKSYLAKLMMNKAITYYKPNGKLCFFDPEDRLSRYFPWQATALTT